MNGYEKEINSREEQKNKIRARYRGVDRSELEFIPAKQKEKLFEETGTKRVCAYCRVSTDDVNQTSSYELQKNHYEDMIKEHQGWELVGIYADEGISGTSLKHRDEFNRMIEDAVYIQILVNQDNKRMVVRKCEENDKDALRWCIEKPDKRKSRKMSNKLFSAMMYDMMGWDMDCRYKILGYKITHEDETMYIFDLTETEIFMDTKRKKKVKAEAAEKNEAVAATTNQTSEQKAEEVTAKVARKLNRIPFYPKDWQNSFGLPVAEHKKALETNLADGYIEFSSTR